MDWFDLTRRWNIAMAAGFAILLAAIAVKHRDGILIGLGVFGLGAGEHMNNEKMIEWINNGTLTTFHRVNRPLGLVVTAIGILLLAIGVYRVIRS